MAHQTGNGEFVTVTSAQATHRLLRRLRAAGHTVQTHLQLTVPGSTEPSKYVHGCTATLGTTSDVAQRPNHSTAMPPPKWHATSTHKSGGIIPDSVIPSSVNALLSARGYEGRDK